MISANFNSYRQYVTDSLHQWDINQTLNVSGLNLNVAPEVHFSNCTMDKAIVKQSTNKNHIVSVMIPNSLLQMPFAIEAYIGIYEGTTFKVIEKVVIPVKPRPRSVDYQIQDSDEEIYSFKRLENMISNLNTEWESSADTKISAYVSSWLSDDSNHKAIKDYVTPQMFGAKGDGVTNDTDAFKDALSTGKNVYIPSGKYVLSSLTIPENAYIEMEGTVFNSHAENKTVDYYSSNHAVIVLNGTITLSPHVTIKGGVIFTTGTAFLIKVADYRYQGINIDNVTVIGDGSNKAIGVLIDASDNSTAKSGYLTLSRFNMLINKCYYGYRIYRPQTTGYQPWITFVTFEGNLTECYQGVSTVYGNITHANGSGVYNLTCCGGSIYKNSEDAYIDISGDMPVVNCLFSDIGTDHSIQYGLDLTGTLRASVYNYQQGHPIFKNKARYGERFITDSELTVLTNDAMPNAKVYAVRSGGVINYFFAGTFCGGTHVDFGINSPYTRASIDTTYRDPSTNLLIQMAGSAEKILVSNETGADITLLCPIHISVPHYTVN